MPVNELCRVTCRIRRYCMLTFEIELARRFFRQDDFKPKTFKKSSPQRELFVHAELQWQPHPSPARSLVCTADALQKTLLLIGIDIKFGRRGLETGTALALVARNELSAVAERNDVDVAVGCAAVTICRQRLIGKISELYFAKRSTFARHIFLGVQRRAERAHQPGYAGSYHALARLHFKRAQHGII